MCARAHAAYAFDYACCVSAQIVHDCALVHAYARSCQAQCVTIACFSGHVKREPPHTFCTRASFTRPEFFSQRLWDWYT